jgi:fructose-specific phosphotransferase system IIA component
MELNLKSTERDAAIDEMVGLLEADGRVSDRGEFVSVVRAREEHGPTGMEMGIAIPHGKSAAVTRAGVAFGRSQQGIDFGAEDAPSRLLFLIAAPAGTEDLHVTLLAKLARKLIHEDFRAALLQASTPEEAMSVIRSEVQL